MSSVLQYLHTAVFADLQYMTGAFAKYMIHSLTISFNSVIFYKCLNGSGKTTAVNTAYSVASKCDITDSQSNRYILRLNIFIRIYIL